MYSHVGTVLLPDMTGVLLFFTRLPAEGQELATPNMRNQMHWHMLLETAAMTSSILNIVQVRAPSPQQRLKETPTADSAGVRDPEQGTQPFASQHIAARHRTVQFAQKVSFSKNQKGLADAIGGLPSFEEVGPCWGCFLLPACNRHYPAPHYASSLIGQDFPGLLPRT